MRLPEPDNRLKPGTRIVKARADPCDAHQNGVPGRVIEWKMLGTVFAGYMVEWDDMPGIPVYVAPIGRIEPA